MSSIRRNFNRSLLLDLQEDPADDSMMLAVNCHTRIMGRALSFPETLRVYTFSLLVDFRGERSGRAAAWSSSSAVRASPIIHPAGLFSLHPDFNGVVQHTASYVVERQRLLNTMLTACELSGSCA